MHAARTDAGWLQVGEDCARESDWAFLVFPVERSLSYLNPEWPYHPFVGPQEEYSHEKHGLAEIAEALFSEPDFLGFRIVGGVTITRPNSTRRPDGVLVSPFGVVLLELKDHNTSVTLHCGKKSSLQVDTGGGNFRVERNPVEKVAEMMPAFGTYQLTPSPLAPLKTQLAKIGAVIFTNPRVRVTCVGAAGAAAGMPYRAGDVLVVSPTQLGPALRAFAEGAMEKKGPFLDRETIDAICANLVVQAEKNAPSAASQIEVGAFLVDAHPVPEESTPYFQLHRGRFRNRDRRVLVKRFPLTTMGKGTAREEIERLGREAHVLSLLNRVPGVQQCHHSEQGEECLWVVLEDVEGATLSQWLAGSPDRSGRLSLLRDLAVTLEELAGQNIVHRAVNPSNVLVQQRGGAPLLTNFELCRLEDVATLPMAGRRLLDAKFIPEEVNTPGGAVTPAADVYGFGKLACYVLSPDRSLPFGTPMEQANFARQKGAWEKLAAALALPPEGAGQLKRMLSPHPDKRPVGAELVEIVGGWS
jgi:serine/threonine-protein kinase